GRSWSMTTRLDRSFRPTSNTQVSAARRKTSSSTPDKSADVFFGPTAPAGHEANWIQFGVSVATRTVHASELPQRRDQIRLMRGGDSSSSLITDGLEPECSLEPSHINTHQNLRDIGPR